MRGLIRTRRERASLLHPQPGAVRPPWRPLQRSHFPVREPESQWQVHLLLPRRHPHRTRPHAQETISRVRRAHWVRPSHLYLCIQSPIPRTEEVVHPNATPGVCRFGDKELFDITHFSSKKLTDLGFSYKYSLEDMFDGAIQSCIEKGLLPSPKENPLIPAAAENGADPIAVWGCEVQERLWSQLSIA